MAQSPQMSKQYYQLPPEPGGLWGLEIPLQKYIREAKRMMYWYKNTKMYYFLN